MEEFTSHKNNVEKKKFDPATAAFDVETKGVWGMLGKHVALMNGSEDRIGYMDLWDEDPNLPNTIKIKYIGVSESYRGSGAALALYEYALTMAKRYHKDLVLDCAAGVAAYKSFKKFAESNGYAVIENETIQWEEALKRYKAEPGTWTLKISL